MLEEEQPWKRRINVPQTWWLMMFEGWWMPTVGRVFMRVMMNIVYVFAREWRYGVRI